MQQRFLQHSGPGIDSLDYSGQCRQMGESRGDFYNFVTIHGNRLAVSIGDASGKVFAAALMISNVQSSLRTATLFAGSNLAKALQAVVNDEMPQVILPRKNLKNLGAPLLLSLPRRRTLQARPSQASPGLPWGIAKDWQFSA